MLTITIPPVGRLAAGVRTAIDDHADRSTTAGVEHEEVFNADLKRIAHNEGTVGDVNGFAPPGDIHRVYDTSDEVAITLHIYGTDVTRIGSSVRRYYDLRTGR